MKLEDCVTFHNGRAIKKNVGSGYPIYGSNGILGEAPDHLYENAIILGRVGAYCGSVQIEKGKFWASDNTIVIKPTQKADIDFLYHYLHFMDLNRLAGGSAQPLLTHTLLKDIELILPEIKQQIAIGKFLATVDENISVNESAVADLYNLMKLVYKQWFLDFNFPWRGMDAYRGDGGEFQYSNEAEREIPVGWKYVELGELVESINTGLNPRQNFKLGEGTNYYVTIKNLKNGKLILDDKCDRVTDDALSMISKRSKVEAGDILFTSIEPVGVTYYVPKDPTNWNINESVFSLKANTKKVTSEFLFSLLSDDDIKVYTKNVSAGSIHKGIRHSTLKQYGTLLPERSVIESYSDFSRPILKKIDELNNQIAELEYLKSWITPQVLTGLVEFSLAV